MNYNELIDMINNMTGNFVRRSGDIYILPENIKKMPVLLASCEDIQSILITPFLLNTLNDTIYELHYYEFVMEVTNVLESHYINYQRNNVLPKEIVENINPKAIIAKNDKKFLITAFTNYIESMQTMKFECDINSNPDLKYFKLYFQIY